MREDQEITYGSKIRQILLSECCQRHHLLAKRDPTFGIAYSYFEKRKTRSKSKSRNEYQQPETEKKWRRSRRGRSDRTSSVATIDSLVQHRQRRASLASGFAKIVRHSGDIPDDLAENQRTNEHTEYVQEPLACVHGQNVAVADSCEEGHRPVPLEVEIVVS